MIRWLTDYIVNLVSYQKKGWWAGLKSLKDMFLRHATHIRYSQVKTTSSTFNTLPKNYHRDITIENNILEDETKEKVSLERVDPSRV